MRNKLKRVVRGMAATISALIIALICKGRVDLTPSGVILSLLIALITSQVLVEMWFVQLDRAAGIRMMTGRRRRNRQNWDFDMKKTFDFDTDYVQFNIKN